MEEAGRLWKNLNEVKEDRDLVKAAGVNLWACRFFAIKTT
jgi:hypothetical protein